MNGLLNKHLFISMYTKYESRWLIVKYIFDGLRINYFYNLKIYIQQRRNKKLKPM